MWQQCFQERYGQVRLTLEKGGCVAVNRAEKVSEESLQLIRYMMLSQSMGHTVSPIRKLREFNHRRGLHRQNVKLSLLYAYGLSLNQEYIQAYERAWAIHQQVSPAGENLMAQQARVIMAACASGLGNYPKALAYLRCTAL